MKHPLAAAALLASALTICFLLRPDEQEVQNPPHREGATPSIAPQVETDQPSQPNPRTLAIDSPTTSNPAGKPPEQSARLLVDNGDIYIDGKLFRDIDLSSLSVEEALLLDKELRSYQLQIKEQIISSAKPEVVIDDAFYFQNKLHLDSDSIYTVIRVSEGRDAWYGYAEVSRSEFPEAYTTHNARRMLMRESPLWGIRRKEIDDFYRRGAESESNYHFEGRIDESALYFVREDGFPEFMSSHELFP